MDTLPRLDERLTTLEVKACYSDDLLDHLNRQVARQQDQIDLLLREVQRLRQQLPQLQDSDNAPRSARDDLPPHY
jgi:SlyX protein